LDCLELGLGEPGERVGVDPASPDLAIDGLTPRRGECAVVDQLLDRAEERLLVDGGLWRVGLVRR
jgi:hypothetical protein